MPPAFNLSQDQTLQFNLCFDCNTFLYQSILKILTRFLLSKSLLSSVNVCFFSFATNKRPRLSSVFFLKIVSLYHLRTSNKAFCLSSSQKRNYEPLFNPCQQLFLFYFLKTPKKQTLKSLPTPHPFHLQLASVQRRNEIMALPLILVNTIFSLISFFAFSQHFYNIVTPVPLSDFFAFVKTSYIYRGMPNIDFTYIIDKVPDTLLIPIALYRQFQKDFP